MAVNTTLTYLHLVNVSAYSTVALSPPGKCRNNFHFLFSSVSGFNNFSLGLMLPNAPLDCDYVHQINFSSIT